MPFTRREAVIYRAPMRSAKKPRDNNAGKPGYASCSVCKRYARVRQDGTLFQHSINGKTIRHGGWPCYNFNISMSDAAKAMNDVGYGQRRIAKTFGTTRWQVRKVLEKA